MTQHLGNKIASPALLGRITTDFVKRVEFFIGEQDIPRVEFKKKDRKDTIANRCKDHEALQQICDSLGSDQIEAFFRKWVRRLPCPLSRHSITAGYRHEISVWQCEFSRTQVFDRPMRGREFSEVVIRENIDLGRPDRVQLLFDRKIIKSTPGSFRSRIVTRGVSPSLHVQYKSTDIKQYFKENRAARTECTINNPKDFDVNKRLKNLPYLKQIVRNAVRRLLEVERVTEDCVLSEASVERLTQPTLTDEGQRASGFRFGDPRVMALFAVLTLFLHLPNGFRNRDLRKHVSDLLDVDPPEYHAGKMTYDLRRLRLKGVIARVPGTTRYFLTPYGYRVSLFLTRLHARLFRPGLASIDPASTAHVPHFPMYVVVTGGGTVVRAEDGKVVVARMLGDSGYNSPTVLGDRVYRWPHGDGTGYRLIMLDRNHVGARLVWSSEGGPYARGLAIFKDHLYGLAGGQWHGGYHIFDARTGKEITRENNKDESVTGRGSSWVSVVVAGDHVSAADRGTSCAHALKNPVATITVLQAPPQGRILAHNTVEKTLHAHPWFVDDKLHIRNDPYLTCIGYAGDEGRAYEAEVNARHVLGDIPDRPGDPKAFAAWQADIQANRRVLDRIVKHRPDSDLGRRAKRLLAEAGK